MNKPSAEACELLRQARQDYRSNRDLGVMGRMTDYGTEQTYTTNPVPAARRQENDHDQ